MQGTEFLQYVWRYQPLGQAALTIKGDAEDWEQGTIDLPEVPAIDLSLEHYALYFCPNTFKGHRRKRDTLPSRWLYQDLDEIHPYSCPLRPTLWWETSPARYQGLWLLDDHLHPDDLAPLNKALNRACGADPGTWNLTRLLRVPGSWNGKRDCRVSEAHVEEHVRLVQPEAVLV